MKLMTTRAVVFTFVMLLGAQEARALHEYFNSIDVNTDGKVSEKELAEDMKEHAFVNVDADRNKSISLEEWRRLHGEGDKGDHMKLFESMDRDRDKRISFLEFSDYAERHSNIEEAFMGLDKDGSNNLSPDELTVRPLFKWITIRF